MSHPGIEPGTPCLKEFKIEKISALNEMKLKMPTPTMPAEKSRKNRKKVGIRSEKIFDFPELI
ncbi:MAG: hypothetical protein ACLRRE_08080 [[Eubacterium] siraeum]